MLAGLLVRFGKVNVVDLRVVQNDLFNRYGILMSPFAIDYRGSRNCSNIGGCYFWSEKNNRINEKASIFQI